MIKKRKGADLSINVIIIAAIALIVLVVLIAVFTGRFGIFSSGVKGAVACNEYCGSIGKVSCSESNSKTPQNLRNCQEHTTNLGEDYQTCWCRDKT